MAARRHSKRPALWWLIASCGLRSGEARGLKLRDLDLAEGTLTVYRSKTRTTQVLDLPSNVIAALRDHLTQRRALGGPLFQASPGHHMGDSTLRAELRRLRIKAGVPPIQRVHDLRHIAASLMLANGYPVPTLAAILGHSPNTLMSVYAHAIPKHVIQAPRNIAEVLPYDVLGTSSRQPRRLPAVNSAVPQVPSPSRANLDLPLADR